MKKILLIIAIPFAIAAILGLTFFSGSKPDAGTNVGTLPEIQSVDDIVKFYMDHPKTRGLSIGIYTDGEVQFYNYGICSKKNPQKPTPQILYEIGSITKTFTTALLAQLVREGKVRYDDPVSRHLPPGIIKWNDSLAITLAELATHSSGLPRIPGNMMFKAVVNHNNPYKSYTVENLYDFLRSYTPKTRHKRKTAYSNLGMGLLGHILALADSSSYQAMLKKRIFEPLEMKYSTIEFQPGQLIQGHNERGKPTSQWDLPSLAGAGAIRSNTEDMLKYLQVNINEEMPYAETHTPRADLTAIQKVGLAWIIQQDDETGEEFIWHNGGTGGFRTFAGFNKANRVGVVVLSNAAQSVDLIGMQLLQWMISE